MAPGVVRQILRDRVAGAQSPVAVAVSGGVDSTALALAAADVLPERPLVASFTLRSRFSTDFTTAAAFASRFGFDFAAVYLPVEEMEVCARAEDLICRHGARRKTDVECLWPFTYLLEELRARGVRTLLTGLAADGHFGLSKKAMINCRGSLADFQAFRDEYFAKEDPARARWTDRIAEEDYGVRVVSPYIDQQMFNLFAGATWEELNRPRQKEPIRADFPELDPLRLKGHTNLQLGDSKIAETIGGAMARRHAPGRGAVAAYNAARRSCAGE